MRMEYRKTALSLVSIVPFPSFHLSQCVPHCPFLIRFGMVTQLPRQRDSWDLGIREMFPKRMTSFAAARDLNKSCTLQVSRRNGM